MCARTLLRMLRLPLRPSVRLSFGAFVCLCVHACSGACGCCCMCVQQFTLVHLLQCINSANAHRTPSADLIVCDLMSGNANITNVLSVITSAAMLMYKVRARFAVARRGPKAWLLLRPADGRGNRLG